MSGENRQSTDSDRGYSTYVKPVMGLIGVVLGIGGLIQLVDWRVESIVNSGEFRRELAKHVGRPYIIFDESMTIHADGGAMQYLVPILGNPIEVEIVEQRSPDYYKLLRITVRPKEYLAIAPHLEVLSGALGSIDIERGRAFEWVYFFNIGGYEGAIKEPRFRLEILK
jgi:hypothetical protein